MAAKLLSVQTFRATRGRAFRFVKLTTRIFICPPLLIESQKARRNESCTEEYPRLTSRSPECPTVDRQLRRIYAALTLELRTLTPRTPAV